MHRTFSILTLALFLLVSAHARAAFDPDARAAAVAPYLDEQAFAVIHIDLTKIDLAEGRKLLVSKLPTLPKEQIEKEEATATKWLAALIKAGAREIYVVISLADVPARPPFLVVKSTAGADNATIKSMIQLGPERWANDEVPPTNLDGEVIAGNLVIGHANALARLKEQKPAAKPDLAQAFKVAGDTAVQGVILQSDDTRRVLSETLTTLPGDLKEYSGKDLATGVKYAAVGFDFPPKVSVRIGIQSDNEESAAKLLSLIQDALKLGGQEESVRQLLPRYDELVKAVTPQRNGDRLFLMLNEDNGGVTKVMSMLTPPLQAARTAAARATSTNNLKQFALAMHNYHDTYRNFPPAASTKDGKSLLSWRVQILPFIEESKLYEEFRHDEPWDSEHNKKLIEKMPKIYASPSLDLKPGMTTYLLPTGKGMVFDGGTKTGLAQVRDGTSNTIMIVEANADQAVIWTKPDDLPINLDKPLAGLGEVHKNGFLAAFCDGSVRFISNKIDLKTLALLFQMADDQPVPEF